MSYNKSKRSVAFKSSAEEAQVESIVPSPAFGKREASVRLLYLNSDPPFSTFEGNKQIV